MSDPRQSELLRAHRMLERVLAGLQASIVSKDQATMSAIVDDLESEVVNFLSGMPVPSIDEESEEDCPDVSRH